MPLLLHDERFIPLPGIVPEPAAAWAAEPQPTAGTPQQLQMSMSELPAARALSSALSSSSSDTLYAIQPLYVAAGAGGGGEGARRFWRPSPASLEWLSEYGEEDGDSNGNDS